VTFSQLIDHLGTTLARPLPGAAAQARMAPRPRREWPAGFNPARIRRAAGLLLVFAVKDRPHILLTVRADTLGRHGGQVSLPGGVIDPGETVEQAALREAHEEVGLAPNGVRVLGTLTPLDIPVSGFRLHPVVASCDIAPHLVPSDAEVARILAVDVHELQDPSRVRWTRQVRDGRTIDVPAFYVGDDEIWGATAMILAEFLTLLGWSGPAAD